MRVRLATLFVVILMPLVVAGSSFETATSVGVDGTSTTFTFSSDETFYVQFPLTEGRVYEVTATASSPVDPFLEVYWPSQALLAENRFDYASPTGTSSRIVFEAPSSATFFASVTETANRAGSVDLAITELGVLEPTMVTQPLSVGRYDTFLITTEVTCVGGPCGEVTAVLDPIPEVPKGVRAQGDVASVEVVYQQFDPRSMRQRSITAKQELSLETIESLAQNPSVVMIEPNLQVVSMLSSSVPSIRGDLALQQEFANTTLSGRGHTVCVIDTGVDYRHPDLGGCALTSDINDGSCDRVIGGYNFFDGNSNPMDDNGHGTHVAGIVASTNSVHTGVAPGARIVAMRALGPDGVGDFSNVRNSIDWCTANAQALNITSIVMSLGTPNPYVNSCDFLAPAFFSSVQAAVDNNISVYAAAGNQYSLYPWQGMSFPACLSNVIAIGATSDAGAWSSYTKRDVMLDLVAPGNSITAPAHNSVLQTTKSGTSMATPHAAALGVLVRERFALLHNRRLTPFEEQLALMASAVPRRDSTTEPNSGLTRGRIDAINATNIKGVVPMTEGATPFWTPTQNPDSCGFMLEGDSCAHTWVVNATGELGGYEFFTIYLNEYSMVETDRIVVTITDTAPPSTSDNAPLTWQNESFTISLSASGAVAYTSYRIHGSPWINGTEILIDTEGNTTVEYFSVSSEGVVEPVKTAFGLLDLTPPQSVSSGLEGWQSSPVLVNVSAFDALSGVAYTSVRLDAWQNATSVLVEEEGNSTVQFFSVDNAGNREPVQNRSVLLDLTPPVTVADAPASWQNSSVNVSFSATDALSGVQDTFVFVNDSFVSRSWLAVSDEGESVVRFYAVDVAGNVEDEQNVSVRIDYAPPVLNISAPVSWQNSSVNVSFSATDELSGVNRTEYRVGDDWVLGSWVEVSAEGETSVDVRAHDTAGNTMSDSRSVRIDYTPPVTTHNAPAGWQSEPVPVELSATDALSGVSQTRWRLNDGSWTTGSQVLVSEPGNSTLSFYSVDNAGNREPVQNVSVLFDPDAPSLVVHAPSQWQNSSVNVSFTSQDPVERIEYRLDGGSWVEGLWVVVVDEGETVVEARATSSAGVVSSPVNATVRIDYTPPVTSTSPPSGWQSGSVTLSFSAIDALSGVAQTRHRIDGGPWRTQSSATISAQGNTTVEYYSVDAAGNQEVVRSVFVLIESEDPEVFGVAPTSTLAPNQQGTIRFFEESASGVVSARMLSPSVASAVRVGDAWFVNATFSSAGSSQVLLETTTLAGRVSEHVSSVVVFSSEEVVAADVSEEQVFPVARARLRGQSSAPVNVSVRSSSVQPPELSVLPNLVRVVNASVSRPVDWALLTVEFSEDDVADLENLRLSFFDPSSRSWIPLSAGTPPNVISTGVDRAAGRAWANLTSLSVYALSGDVAPPPQPTPPPSQPTPPPPTFGGGGGGAPPPPEPEEEYVVVEESSEDVVDVPVVSESVEQEVVVEQVPVEVVEELSEPQEQEPAVVSEAAWYQRGIPIPFLFVGVSLVLLGVVVLEQRELRKKLFHHHS